MDALTFPLDVADLADLMMVETVSWRLTEDQELSGLGGGEGLTADLGPRLWEGDCSTIAADIDTIEALRARFNTLDGAIRSFYLYDRRRPNPPSDPTGALLTGATPTIESVEADRKRLTLQGLPPGYELGQGTLMSITAGAPSRTMLIQLATPSVADELGMAGPVEFRPHARPWVASGQDVKLLKPVVKVKLLPRSLSVQQVTSVLHRLRFTARQTLAAG